MVTVLAKHAGNEQCISQKKLNQNEKKNQRQKGKLYRETVFYL